MHTDCNLPFNFKCLLYNLLETMVGLSMHPECKSRLMCLRRSCWLERKVCLRTWEKNENEKRGVCYILEANGFESDYINLLLVDFILWLNAGIQIIFCLQIRLRLHAIYLLYIIYEVLTEVPKSTAEKPKFNKLKTKKIPLKRSW